MMKDNEPDLFSEEWLYALFAISIAECSADEEPIRYPQIEPADLGNEPTRIAAITIADDWLRGLYYDYHQH